MIVRYNSLNRMETPQFTLCSPGSIYTNNTISKQVGMLTDHEAEEIVFNFNATSELNLRVNRVQREDPEENAHTYAIYKAIQNRRLIFVDNIGYFMITGIEDGFDGGSHYKDIKAQSIDIEIQQKMIPHIPNGTYRFSTDDTPGNKGILETIVETLPLWSIGYVDETVASKWRTFEDVSTSLNCLSFLLQNVQDAYECICVFDCVHRVINVYAQDNYVRQTDVHITKDDLINSLDISEDADNLYTAISVFGEDNVTISAINPLGTNVIYNFAYYYDWMSNDLGEKVSKWHDAVESARAGYRGYSLGYYQELDTVNALQLEIEKLDNQIKMYTRCRNNIIAESDTALVSSYNAAISENGGTEITIYPEISKTLEDIDALISACENQKGIAQTSLDNAHEQSGIYKSGMDAIRDSLSMENYFTESEYEELCHYIFEGSYTDEYVITTDSMTYTEKFEQMDILYDRALNQLARISQPTREFSVDVENFIFMKEFAHWSEQLETGCLINVELDVDDVAPLFLSNMTINYDDHKLTMTFGNRFNKFDPKSLFNDMLGDISKTANTLSYIKEVLYPLKNGEFNSMQEALHTSRNLTMGKALSSQGEAVVIDGSGYTGRRVLPDGSIDPRQVKITGRNLVFTDDAWDSCKVAIGEIQFGKSSSYGVNAETIIGDMILGNNIRIIDNNGRDLFTIVDGKISASLGDVNSRLLQLAAANSALSLRVTDVENRGEINQITTVTGYVFGAEGLQIARKDAEIANRINHEGMYVSRIDASTGQSETILSVDSDGVNAINLAAKNFLIVGDSGRFENYDNGGGARRIACFYTGGNGGD